MLVVRVLGTVHAEVDGSPIRIASAKQRLLLAVLAISRGPVSRSRLIDALWPEAPPPSAPATVMGYVSRVRAALGADALISGGDAYRLVADRVDATEFEAQLRHDLDVSGLEHALALWDGQAFGDLAGHPQLAGEAAKLEELRMDARLRLAALYVADGDTARCVSMLEAIVADQPLREDAWVLLVRALLQSSRAAEALRAAARCRRQLASVGLDPGHALVEAEAQALQVRAADVPATAVDPVIGSVRYARCRTGHLAYQVVGGGPVDVVMSSYGSVSIDAIWDEDRFRSFVLRVATSCRVVLYDTSGIGLSDPIELANPPTIEQQSEDLRCVIEAAGATKPVVVGIGDAGPTAITYAYGHPRGLVGLVLVNTFARLVEADDYPCGVPRERFEANLSMAIDPDGGRDTSLVLRNHAPSAAGDAEFRRWWERSGRRGASPATAAALWRVRYGADVRAHLSRVSTPTLVVHRRHSRVVPYVHGRYVADHIPGARLADIDGRDQTPFTEHGDEVAELIAGFATEVGARPATR